MEQNNDYAALKKTMISELVTTLVVGFLIYEILDLNQNYTDLNLIIPGALLLFILLQGAGYWYYRMQIAGERNFDREKAVKTFAILEKADIILFAVYPVWLAVALLAFPDAVYHDTILFGVLTEIVAAVEYFSCYRQSLNWTNWKEKKPSNIRIMLDEYREKKNADTH